MATYKAEAIVMPNGDEFVPDENVFVAEYGVTTWAEVNAAHQAGKVMYCRRDMGGWSQQLAFSEFDGDGNCFYFSADNYDGSMINVVNIYEGEPWDNYTQKTHAYPDGSFTPSNSYYLAGLTQNGVIKRSNIQFGSSTTKYLSQKGTWENIPVTSVNGSTGAVTGLQTTANLVTSVSSASTDSQYPSAKCLYDMVGDIETLLAAI